MNNESKMRVACVYINAGKGHYIPAKAIGDALHAIGVEAVMVDYDELRGIGTHFGELLSPFLRTVVQAGLVRPR